MSNRTCFPHPDFQGLLCFHKDQNHLHNHMQVNTISQLSSICMNEMHILIACIDTQSVHHAPLVLLLGMDHQLCDNSESVIDQPYPTGDSMSD